MIFNTSYINYSRNIMMTITKKNQQSYNCCRPSCVTSKSVVILLIMNVIIYNVLFNKIFKQNVKGNLFLFEVIILNFETHFRKKITFMEIPTSLVLTSRVIQPFVPSLYPRNKHILALDSNLNLSLSRVETKQRLLKTFRFFISCIFL